MTTVALAVICKNPTPGRSKTRLGSVLSDTQCEEISACFIADLAETIEAASHLDPRIEGYALYTPIGSEPELRKLLPTGFGLVPQAEGDFGDRLHHGIVDLLALGHSGAIVINSDSPTLPRQVLLDAAAAVLERDRVVLGPAEDGGYTLIGLSKPHRELFDGVAWSTATVLAETRDRARSLDLPVIEVGHWYDIDDRASFDTLVDELHGRRPAFGAGNPEPVARRTRRFLDTALAGVDLAR